MAVLLSLGMFHLHYGHQFHSSSRQHNYGGMYQPLRRRITRDCHGNMVVVNETQFCNKKVIPSRSLQYQCRRLVELNPTAYGNSIRMFSDTQTKSTGPTRWTGSGRFLILNAGFKTVNITILTSCTIRLVGKILDIAHSQKAFATMIVPVQKAKRCFHILKTMIICPPIRLSKPNLLCITLVGFTPEHMKIAKWRLHAWRIY